MMSTITQPFKVGDLVQTNIHSESADVVRKVLKCVRSNCATGWLVVADGGEPCPHCGRRATPTVGASGQGIGSDWFTLVSRAKAVKKRARR